MSTIVVLKQDGQAIVGTDSRFMEADYSGVASDAEQKIFEIAPGTWIATSGWNAICDFQVSKARELAKTSNDIRTIAKELETATIPVIDELVKHLRLLPVHERVYAALQGQFLIHHCALVGRTASGELGYCTHAYGLRAGQVVNQPNEYFGSERQIFVSSGEPAQALAGDPSIWIAEPLWVVRRFLETMKRVCDTIGGPDQIAIVDRDGSRWIDRPPAGRLEKGFATGDALFAGQATFAYSGGGKVTINSSGLALADNNVSPTSTVTIASGGVTIAKVGTSYSVQISAYGVGVYGPTCSVTVGASSVSIVNGSYSLVASPTNIKLLGGGYSTVVSSSDVRVYSVDGNTASPYVTISTGVGVQYVDGLTGSNASIFAQGGIGQIGVRGSDGTTVSILSALSTTASAGMGTLPAAPYKFINASVNGISVRIPCYLP